jgi:hypothetical protein
MDFVALVQQKLCEIGAVLTRDAGDERDFFHSYHKALLIIRQNRPMYGTSLR